MTQTPTRWKNAIVEYGEEAPDQLLANPQNWRTHPQSQKAALLGSLNDLGWIAPVIVNRITGHVVDGHARIGEAIARGEPSVPVAYVELTPAQEAEALAVLDPIAAMAGADREQLDALLHEVTTGEAGLQAMLADLAQNAGLEYLDGADAGTDLVEPVARASLADRFLVPPFSVLDARQGYWQERKRAWLALGIQSELGRGDNVLDGGHSDQSINIDFYARKRRLEADLGRELSTDEARNILVERGEIRHVDRSKAGKDNGLLGEAEQARSHYRNASPGGAPRDAARLGADGHTVRGDGRGRGLTWTGKAAEFDGYRVQNGERESTEVSGTSIFDPVLCELVYRWFSPSEGHVLDPFAGGSVRGIVATLLGRQYTGVDLSERQIEANRAQAVAITPALQPTWHVGDSRAVADLAPGTYDLVFSCPPYADLEVYSDDPRDLSTLSYADFLAGYRAIIAASVGLLAPDRFACFVVGDVRDGKGWYRNFVSDTIAAFQDAGAQLYNEAILVTAVGSLPIRVGKQFESGRKLGKTHQNVLVFCKGNPQRATAACGPVDVADPAEGFGEVAS